MRVARNFFAVAKPCLLADFLQKSDFVLTFLVISDKIYVDIKINKSDDFMENSAEIKVSVIMPIYNAADFLRPALDSVLAQTLTDVEVICIDDGSTDNSLEIIKEYLEKDERIRILTETNAGPALARNNGIRRARGEYLAFLDADDFYDHEFLESLYTLAKRDELDIAISQYDIYNTRKSRFEPATSADHSDIFVPDKVTSKSEHPDFILASTTGSAWNKLFRRAFVVDNGLLFLHDVRMYEDVYFVVSAMSLAERVGKVHRVLMHHRIHSQQSRAKHFSKYYSQVPLVYLKIKEFLMARGMYAPLYLSYLNLSVSRCYKIFNILSGDAKERFWNMLHDEYAELLGWQGKDAAEFEMVEFCEFAVCVQLYTYAEYKKRKSRGKKFSPTHVKQDVELAKKKKRFRRFFGKIFGRKEKK